MKLQNSNVIYNFVELKGQQICAHDVQVSDYRVGLQQQLNKQSNKIEVTNI